MSRRHSVFVRAGLGLMVLTCLTWRAPAAPEPSRLVVGNTQFAFDLYATLATRKGNLAFSPFSISTALAMTEAGASGETALEMSKVLHLPKDAPSAFGALLSDLGKPQLGTQLSMANRIWPSKGLRLRQTFSRLLETAYHAQLQSLDFGQAEQARQEINAWVSLQTQGKVIDLVPKGLLDSRTLLVLTSAVYFQGSWASPFAEIETKQCPFVGSDGKTSPCWMMRRIDQLMWAEVDNVQVLEMPYRGGRLSMIVVLPKPGGLPELERNLDDAHWQQWLQRLELTHLAIRIPRFKVEGEFSLADRLQQLGMRRIFGGGAELGALTENGESVFVSDCIHKAVVEVNEQGTVAAAATAVAMTRGLSRTFDADHPFIFAIRDQHSGSVLFLGRVERP
ncbi:serpin family protein [bacterium]|nr:serpin family protein [bacterium]